MRNLLATLLLSFVVTPLAFAADLQSQLLDVEKTLWTAWGKKDGEPFKKALTADAVEVVAGTMPVVGRDADAREVADERQRLANALVALLPRRQQPVVRPQGAAEEAHAVEHPDVALEHLHGSTLRVRPQLRHRGHQVAAVELVIAGDEQRRPVVLRRPGHRGCGARQVAGEHHHIGIGRRRRHGLHR